MSTSPTIYKDESQNNERRSGPRAPLNWVVLLYFGQDNWGKLVDLSENGMRFEFAQPPSDCERINFKFEAMGRLPASFGGETITDSFEAAGDLRWTRDFERTAGVQFVTLPEESREKIREWLSYGASAITGPPDTKLEQEPVPVRERYELVQAPPETLPAIYEDEHELQLDAKPADCGWEQFEDPTGALAENLPEVPAFEDRGEVFAEEETAHTEAFGANPRLGRTLVIGMTISIAAVIVIGGIRMMLPRLAHGVPAVERLPSPTTDGESVSAEYATAPGGRRPFLVEVLDANNQRWLLWFDDSDPKNAPTRASYKSSLPFSTAPLKGASPPKQPATSPTSKSPIPQKFTPIAPKASRPQVNRSAANSLSPVAPVVRDEPQPPLEAPLPDILSGPAISSPISGSAPVGGRVQVAHLLKSVPPVFPPMARTSHVSGDVEMDALIDANGNVTGLKVVSGPPILRQAAIDAVRQWKYDPARLNGQPVAMHLGITVKFHFQ
jgi:TonB family protein